MRNGRLSFITWLLMLAVYTGFRAFGIQDTVITNAVIGFTGLLIGNLGIAQGARQTKTEERAKDSAKRIEQLEDAADVSVLRADASEQRESQWSKHKDHAGDDDG